jgi:hypothetical protein
MISESYVKQDIAYGGSNDMCMQSVALAAPLGESAV